MTLCDDWLEKHGGDKPAHKMIARHGVGPEGKTCQTCSHLYGKQYAKRYYKCELMGHSGMYTDWRVNRQACGQYREGTPKVYYGG